MTIKQYADSIGVSKNTVKYHIKKHKLTLDKVNGISELNEEQIAVLSSSIGKEPQNHQEPVLEPAKTTKEPPKTSQEPVFNNREPVLEPLRTTKEPVQEPPKTTTESHSESVLANDYINTLQEQIKYLKEQISEKDNIIAKQDADYKELADKMSKALLNAQMLNGADKLLLSSDNAEQNIDDGASEPVQKHRGILSFLHRKH